MKQVLITFQTNYSTFVADIIAEPFVFLFNVLIASGYIPSDWKITNLKKIDLIRETVTTQIQTIIVWSLLYLLFLLAMEKIVYKNLYK